MSMIYEFSIWKLNKNAYIEAGISLMFDENLSDLLKLYIQYIWPYVCVYVCVLCICFTCILCKT